MGRDSCSAAELGLFPAKITQSVDKFFCFHGSSLKVEVMLISTRDKYEHRVNFCLSVLGAFYSLSW